jgi:hypothetical protein
MDGLMHLLGAQGEIQDADVVFNLIVYILVMLRSDDCQCLGARFIEECSFVEALMHED